jgi:glycosyltransferase involved in cell wall biosynthesis
LSAKGVKILQKPLISIVIPVKNGENFLEEAIQSALLQDYPNLEIVIGINPSDDRSVEIARKFGHQKHLKIYEFSESVNMPQNFNRSAQLATGKFIKFLCHDDLLPPKSVSTLYAEICKNHSSVLSVGFETFINSVRPMRDAISLGQKRQVLGLTILRRILRYGNWVGGPSAWLIKSSVFEERPFNANFNCSFDLEYLAYLGSIGSLSIAHEVTLNSRVHAGQESRRCESEGFSIENKEILQGIHSLKGLNLACRFFLFSYRKLIHLYL